jgi:hypothetical protein
VSLIKVSAELRVSENRVLGKLFGPKRDEVPEDWRKYRDEVLHDLYCSPNIIRLIISRRIRWGDM